MFTAQQNIAQRGHDEGRDSLSNISDINRGTFLEIIHLRCKDIAWLNDKLDSRDTKRTATNYGRSHSREYHKRYASKRMVWFHLG